MAGLRDRPARGAKHPRRTGELAHHRAAPGAAAAQFERKAAQ
jgi:hypothetical protein